MLSHSDQVIHRHIGPSVEETAAMLQTLGFSELNIFIDQVVPQNIRSRHPMLLPADASEHAVLNELPAIAAKNQVFRSFLGMGYSNCITPPVIQRNILENPGWLHAIHTLSGGNFSRQARSAVEFSNDDF